MLFLITADNFLVLFLGWEGVGLCSYLLISFWYTRIAANKAAIKALLVNRVSDFGFTLGLLCLFSITTTIDFSAVFPGVFLLENLTVLFLGVSFNGLELVTFLLFTGAMGKSAQIGLHTWLPDAMEGPTPVSALIHAATMVTAGVFLVIKSSVLFEHTPTILNIVVLIGGLTAFFAATSGLLQSDIKKVIAYSTCSQLGYMFFICGLSGYNIALFHLANHAFFKALLFLSAGGIIHSMSNEQDMRKYGSLLTKLPFLSVMLLLGSLALAGFPFLTGYYSKDLIIEYSFGRFSNNSNLVFVSGVLTAFLTAFYSLRVFYLAFLLPTTTFRPVLKIINEGSIILLAPLGVLGLGSVFFGYLFKDLCVGPGSPVWNSILFILPHNNTFMSAEFIPLKIKLLPFCLSIVAFFMIIILFTNPLLQKVQKIFIFSPSIQKLLIFLISKWEFDLINNKTINIPLLRFSYDTTFKNIDKGVVETLGPTYLSAVSVTFSRLFLRDHSGEIYRYAWFIVAAWFSLLIGHYLIVFNIA